MSRSEMGGNNNPTGLYLSSAGFGGSVSLQPRLEGNFDWILLAATAAAAIGEIGIDCVLSILSMTLAPGQPVQAEIALQGREPRLTTTGAPASGWT